LYRVLVITDASNADGFKLAGCDAVACADSVEAMERLATALDDDTVGIVALNSSFAERIPGRMQKKIDRVARPIVVPLPLRDGTRVGDRRSYLARLIRSATGIDVNLGR
jgi:V/A-type H+-transporting ATPase subunit F